MKNKIVCLGDSNTYGLDPRSFLGETYENAWPTLLEKDYDVFNYGINGACIYYQEKDLIALQSIIKNYDIILVMLGSNDILENRSKDIIEERMDIFISFLSSYPCILICPIDNKNILFPIYQKVSDKYHIPLANANEWDIELSFDQIHFSEEGHKQFYKRIKDIL